MHFQRPGSGPLDHIPTLVCRRSLRLLQHARKNIHIPQPDHGGGVAAPANDSIYKYSVNRLPLKFLCAQSIWAKEEFRRESVKLSLRGDYSLL